MTTSYYYYKNKMFMINLGKSIFISWFLHHSFRGKCAQLSIKWQKNL